MAFQIVRNLSVRWRLLGFIFCLLLFIILAGTGGLLGMRDTKESLSKVYNNHVKPMEELRQINELFKFNVVTTVERILYEQIIWDDAVNAISTAYDKIDRKINELLVDSDKSIEGGDDWLSTDRAKITEAKVVIQEVITAVKKKDIEKVDTLFAERLEPFQDEFGAMINTLIIGRIAAVESEYRGAEKRYAMSQTAFVLTIVVGVCVGLVIGFLLMKSINDPLKRITKAINIMKQGDLTHKLQYDSKNEFGELIDGFNQMADYLEDLISQIQHAGIQVTSSITEIAASTRQQEASATEHAATASEIAASTSQIAATSANLIDRKSVV